MGSSRAPNAMAYSTFTNNGIFKLDALRDADDAQFSTILETKLLSPDITEAITSNIDEAQGSMNKFNTKEHTDDSLNQSDEDKHQKTSEELQVANKKHFDFGKNLMHTHTQNVNQTLFILPSAGQVLNNSSSSDESSTVTEKCLNFNIKSSVQFNISGDQNEKPKVDNSLLSLPSTSGKLSIKTNKSPPKKSKMLPSSYINTPNCTYITSVASIDNTSEPLGPLPHVKEISATIAANNKIVDSPNVNKDNLMNVDLVSDGQVAIETACVVQKVNTNNNNEFYINPFSMHELKPEILLNLQSISGLNKDLIGSKLQLSHKIESSKLTLESVLENEKDNISVRDLALASTSSQDIQFIDDEDCLVPALNQATSYKTDSKDSKVTGTFSEKTILEIEDLITNYPFFFDTINKCPPAKSNLKRKLTNQGKHEKKSLKKSDVKFTNVTIFYFEREQGFCSVPSKGGSTLGMTKQHFYITTLPIDEYEHKKVQRHSPMKRNTNIIYKRSDSTERIKTLEALPVHDRIHLLESSEVQIEPCEEDECSEIRSSRAAAGCSCKEYCYPDTCFCSLSGIECQVDRPNFPCGCSRESCKNIVGRSEYNHNRVRSHFVQTMRKVHSESKSRYSKRKQATPNKMIIANPELNKEVNLIH